MTTINLGGDHVRVTANTSMSAPDQADVRYSKALTVGTADVLPLPGLPHTTVTIPLGGGAISAKPGGELFNAVATIEKLAGEHGIAGMTLRGEHILVSSKAVPGLYSSHGSVMAGLNQAGVLSDLTSAAMKVSRAVLG